MLPKLCVPAIVENILVRAVHLHPDERDYQGMAEYARVMPESRIPRVVRAIFARVPYLSPVKATARGHAAALQKLAGFRRFGCPMGGLERAVEDGHLSTLEFWRGSPSLKRILRTQRVISWSPAARVALGIDLDCSRGADAMIHPPADYDVAIDSICSGVATGAVTELILTHRAISLAGIHSLNEAMASPTQALTSITVDACTIDLPRLLAFRFPPSVTAVSIASPWLKPVLGQRYPTTAATAAAPAAVRWPANLSSLSLSLMKLWDATVPYLVPHFPPTLSALHLSNCRMQDPALAALLRAIPHLASLSLRDVSLDYPRLVKVFACLPPSLVSLDISGAKLIVHAKAALPIWQFPPDLLDLTFTATAFERRGLDALATSLPTKLRTLEITRCDFGPLSTEAALTTLTSALPASIKCLALGGLAYPIVARAFARIAAQVHRSSVVRALAQREHDAACIRLAALQCESAVVEDRTLCPVCGKRIGNSAIVTSARSPASVVHFACATTASASGTAYRGNRVNRFRPFRNQAPRDLFFFMSHESATRTELRALVCGCGDLAEVARTVCEAAAWGSKQNLSFTLNDWQPEVLARNMLILHALAFSPADEADLPTLTRNVGQLRYSHFLDPVVPEFWNVQMRALASHQGVGVRCSR
ncbi:Vacuolar morphogenesis protein 6 [Blastocladiella emersonii ATCC 22665]|nr:Vacuolar morphogenesis protein 6 [Blastocladiella emersonii ATCC 22665]